LEESKLKATPEKKRIEKIKKDEPVPHLTQYLVNISLQKEKAEKKFRKLLNKSTNFSPKILNLTFD
jgi:hypothetical protein